MMLLFQGDRQLKGTDVCIHHGHGGVSTVMQLVSTYTSPRATCEPLLNMKKSFPDGTGRRTMWCSYRCLWAYFPSVRSSTGKGSAGLKRKEMVS